MMMRTGWCRRGSTGDEAKTGLSPVFANQGEPGSKVAHPSMGDTSNHAPPLT